MSSSAEPTNINLSSTKFLTGCLILSIGIIFVGQDQPIPPWLIMIEVFLTVILLFALGSFKYTLNKNAITYGSGIVVSASFFTLWWPTSSMKVAYYKQDWPVIQDFLTHNFMTLQGLDDLIHADIMLFILCLTFFVAVIAQTRILESISIKLLTATRGNLLLTIALIIFLVSLASGILDGVSMIGLLIRTMIILLLLARVKKDDIIFTVIISTVVTTVCGIYLAYGEPPNLIMKENLDPLLDNWFFLFYCAPVAFLTYGIVILHLRKRLATPRVKVDELDIVDKHLADIRFLQAVKHGQTPSPIEFIDEYKDRLGDLHPMVITHLHQGKSLGVSMISSNVSPLLCKEILSHFYDDSIADYLYTYYSPAVSSSVKQAAGKSIEEALKAASTPMVRSQVLGTFALITFAATLVLHSTFHFPLFISPLIGSIIAMIGIMKFAAMSKLAFSNTLHEYKEYLFLLPLFFSIALLEKTHIFSAISQFLHWGVDTTGVGFVAYSQFLGATVLSAMLDNNVVADFLARAINDFSISIVHLFAMAQIVGYAAGGCWTHIGSAQSVVAYAFIQREVDSAYTPLQWMKMMTPIIFHISILMALVILILSI